MAKRTRGRDRGATDRRPPTDEEIRAYLAKQPPVATQLLPTPQPLAPNRPAATELITAADLRDANTYMYELPSRPGKLWRLRKVEAFDLFMRGLISAPLVASLDKVADMRERLKTTKNVFDAISDAEKAEILGSMHEWARAVLVTPSIVDVDDGNPAHITIDMLTFWDLFWIMNAAPVTKTTATPRLSGVDAATFRGDESRVDGDASSNGKNLRGAAERLPAHAEPHVERA